MLRIAIAVALTLATASGANASSRGTLHAHSTRSGGSHSASSHHRGSSPAAIAKKECKAQCKTSYEISIAGCSALQRGEKGSCKHDASATRKDCSARCI